MKLTSTFDYWVVAALPSDVRKVSDLPKANGDWGYALSPLNSDQCPPSETHPLKRIFAKSSRSTTGNQLLAQLTLPSPFANEL
jgi:hypothetical protein